MRKKDALRLKPGSIVLFGDHHNLSNISCRQRGGVKFVTPRGGIRVAVHSYHPPHRSLNTEIWVPYHHVVRVDRRGKDDFESAIESLQKGSFFSGTV